MIITDVNVPNEDVSDKNVAFSQPFYMPEVRRIYPAYFEGHSTNTSNKGINLLTRSGHRIEMIDCEIIDEQKQIINQVEIIEL